MITTTVLGTKFGELQGGRFYTWKWNHGTFLRGERALGLPWIAIFETADCEEFQVDLDELEELTEEEL